LNRRLAADAREAQELREAADYDAREINANEAAAVTANAEEFVAAISALLAG
jgi:uncharacterized protein (UPF0332 family)